MLYVDAGFMNEGFISKMVDALQGMKKKPFPMSVHEVSGVKHLKPWQFHYRILLQLPQGFPFK